MSEKVTLDEFTKSGEDVESPTGSLVDTSFHPQEWEVVDFEKLIEDIRYGTDTKSNTKENGYPTLRIPNVVEKRITTEDLKHTPLDEGEFERLKLENGDILLLRTNGNPAYVGRCTVFDGEIDDCVFASYLIRIRLNENSSLPKFVSEFLNSNLGRQEMSGWISTSAGNHNIGIGAIENFSVPLPKYEEQSKIATVLYTVDQAIEKTEAIIEQSHIVKKSLMQDVFHGRHKNCKEYQSTPVGEIPTHWSVASIGEVVQTAQYGISESLSEEGQYPIFRMNNIENGYMVDEPLKYIDLDDDEFEKYRVEKGDILFNRTNSLELVGKTGIYELEGDHVFASYLVRLQTNEKVDSHYLNYYMNSSEAQNRMMDFATKGVSQANINANSIQQVTLPLPPVEEQQEIADRLRGIDSQIEANEQYKSQLKRLKRGLMQDLLSGKVRTSDTNIEVPEEIAQYG